MRRPMRLPALAGVLALALAGCGGGAASKQSTPAALKLQREDLVAVSEGLGESESSVAAEVAATRKLWPRIAGGATASLSALPQSPGAAEALTQLPVPALFGETQSRSLTGPASQIAGLFRPSALLSTRGWQMLIASAKQIQSGSAVAARFARENASLYLESIYDGHFALAQIGKKLLAGYDKLGGPRSFGGSLTQAQVDALARAYSEPSIRLYPHVRTRTGS
ncbi:MAG TPA: hypothetical protein VG188_02395 [Solirubrobacteraceae bacterium]|nr:hypothetical protein [Solirubrobacteraceae bacterium]